MKTNLILFSLFIILFSACSKNDDSPKPEEEEVIPVNEKFLNDVNGELTIEYNDDGKIERIKISNLILIIYGYEGGNVSTVDMYGQNANLNFIFNYDANGHIDSFSQDDIITDVTYNQANNYYLYQKENGDEVTLFMNENGDSNKIVEFDNAQDETDTTTILYEDGEYNGTLTNTNNPIMQTLMGLPEIWIYLFLYNISNQPVKTIASSYFGILDLQNTYDEQNFLETSTYQFEEPNILTFNYTKLNP